MQRVDNNNNKKHLFITYVNMKFSL